MNPNSLAIGSLIVSLIATSLGSLSLFILSSMDKRLGNIESRLMDHGG